jgi:hypothetical protein
MKKVIAVAVLATSATAADLPELQEISELEMEQFKTVTKAIEAETYRQKALICSLPEWADKEFILQCLDDAEHMQVIRPSR